MQYVEEVVIDLPRDKVVELFDNPDNLKYWQKGFVSLEPLDGVPGQPGSTSKLVYNMGKREMEMVETIVDRSLPERFVGTYEAPGVWNSVENEFIVLGDAQTKWVSHVEFKFTNIMMKLMGFFMPKAFSKQTKKFMDDFKAFAEQS